MVLHISHILNTESEGSQSARARTDSISVYNVERRTNARVTALCRAEKPACCQSSRETWTVRTQISRSCIIVRFFKTFFWYAFVRASASYSVLCWDLSCCDFIVKYIQRRGREKERSYIIVCEFFFFRGWRCQCKLVIKV